MNMIATPAMAGATVKRDDLVKAMDLIAKVALRTPKVPILEHVLFVAERDGVTLIGTDLDMRLSVRIAATSETVTAGTASSSRLRKLARSLPKGSTVGLHVASDRLCVAGERTTARFWSLPTEDFPHSTFSAGMKDAVKFDMAADVLRGLLDRAFPFVSTEMTRYYLNGVYLEIKGDDLVAVATDGHRLAVLSAPAPEGSKDMPSVILPHEAMSVLRAMIAASAADTVAVQVSKTRMQFAVGNFLLEAKTIDGTFPQYDRVIPAVAGEPIAVNCGEFRSAIRLMGAAMDSKGWPVKLEIQADEMRVFATASERTDEVATTIGVKGGPSKPVEIGFQCRYMLAVLGCIGGDAVLHNIDPPEVGTYRGGGPMRIHDSADPRALYILMPMKI